MDMSDWFDNTVSTKRLVTTLGSSRSPITSFSTYLSSVACVVQQFKGTQPVIAGRKFSQVKWVLYCDHDENIIMSDLVTYKTVDYEIVDQLFEENEDSYMKLLLARAE